MGGFANPAKLICMGFAKNRLASSQKRILAPRTTRGGRSRAQSRPGPRNHPVYQYCYTFVCSQAGRCSARSFLIYPPAGAQWPPRPGGLLGGLPDPAKLIRMGFAKNRLASSHTRRWRGRSPGAWESARGHAAAVQRRPGRWASPPACLPCTPTGLPCTPSRLPCIALPPRPTAPPRQPTLYKSKEQPIYSMLFSSCLDYS